MKERDAVISDDGRYRYLLWRCWDPNRATVTWIMLNPSTADALQDDPTIRRCISFSRLRALALAALEALEEQNDG